VAIVREGYAGSGPGAITPDGCAVELWARLPVGTEPDVVAAAVPPGARLLELGCGVGRVTRPLLERGFDVTAVDESAEMLERVPDGARRVLSTIEDLDLGETFDAVLLGSFLVHAGDVAVRQGLLATCRRHVADGGVVLLQREGDEHHDVPRRRPLPPDGELHVVSAREVEPGVNSVHVEYRYPDATWSQTFRRRPLSHADLDAALAAAGLVAERHLTDDRTWVLAVPAAG
jgi:SAM-dependent methyltransferase